jgi:hypothetical protein
VLPTERTITLFGNRWLITCEMCGAELKEPCPTRNRAIGGFCLNSHKLLIITAVAALAGPRAVGQSDSLAPIRFLEGKWEGSATGEPGKGVSKREYKFDLNGRFFSARNKSVYEPKTSDAKPETHEDFGMYSYDRALKKIVLRQFHGEGFVTNTRWTPLHKTASPSSLRRFGLRTSLRVGERRKPTALSRPTKWSRRSPLHRQEKSSQSIPKRT